MNLNKVTLAGNVTRDIELQYTPQGRAVAQVGMAVNKRIPAAEGREAREEVTFVDVTFFGPVAEVIGKHVSRGTGLFIEGELKLDRWEDKDTGKAKTKLRVIGQHFQFTGPKVGGGKHEAAPPPDAPPRRQQSAPLGGPLDNEDEIPF